MTVSIVLPVFNRAATLNRCVDSVRAQTFSDWELIAVDDGSSDDSIAVIEHYRDPRIRVLRHEVNRGPSAARNTGLAAATGEFIALIDSDDEWLPAKLERQLALLRAENLDACGCDYWLADASGERRVSPVKTGSWADTLREKCELGNGTTLVVRRERAAEIGPFDEELRLYEDWDWMLRFTRRFSYAVVPEPLARVYAGGARNPDLFATGSELFLARHDADFQAAGRGAWLRSKHYENVAANAFACRRFALGCRYVLKSVAAMPSRRPLLLGALPLAMCDGVFGGNLLQRVLDRPSKYPSPQ